MLNFNKSQRILILYSGLVALAAALVLSHMLLSPSEMSSRLLLGLSAPRLVIGLGLLAAFIVSGLLVFKASREKEWADSFVKQWFGEKGFSRGLFWLSSVSLALSWIGCFLPTYRMGNIANYWMRIQPAMSFVLFVSLATLVVFLVVRIKIKNFNFAVLYLGLTLLVVGLAVFGFMFYSKFGIVSSEDFWYGAGVPVLTSQVILAVLGGIILFQFGSKWNSRRSDILICVLLFATTAWAWGREPLQKSFLMTGPYLPNRAFYPFADAALFDVASQFPLIGQKIFILSSVFFERPLYLSFLVYLHTLFGQDYPLLMAVQAGIFAVLPVLIYLIGRSLNMREVGFAAALVTMFRGVNAIAASNLIDTAGPKMILTDFPTAIGIALIILLVCEWLKYPTAKPSYAIWVGGVIGITLMLRTNALMFLILIPVYAFTVFAIKHWRQWVLSCVLILLGAISITLPWELRNLSLGEQMYQPIVAKFQAVIQQRYPTPQPTPSSFEPLDQPFAVAFLKDTQVITATVLQEKLITAQDSIPCNSIICFSTNHFLHNIVTSMLALPTSPMLDDLRHLIKERSPYWQASWNGSLTSSAALLFVINLFFIATGIALAWREKQYIGLVPLMVFVGYNLSNALARTSGGRYLVPFDWILLIYYLLGVFYIIVWLANTLGISWNVFSEPNPGFVSSEKSNPVSLLGAFVMLFLFGSLLPLSEHLYQPRYQNQEPLKMLSDNSSLLENAGITQNMLHMFLQSPNAKVLVGRALYPRYYKANQGEFVNAFYPYQTLGFPRIAFRLIGPAGDYGVILPIGEAPKYFPHTGDMLVVGCNREKYLDAWLVIMLDEHKIMYIRKPAATTSQCPLPQPVCNNNSVCQ